MDNNVAERTGVEFLRKVKSDRGDLNKEAWSVGPRLAYVKLKVRTYSGTTLVDCLYKKTTYPPFECSIFLPRVVVIRISVISNKHFGV